MPMGRFLLLAPVVPSVPGPGYGSRYGPTVNCMPVAGILTAVTIDRSSRTVAGRVGGASTAVLLVGLLLWDAASGRSPTINIVVALLSGGLAVVAARVIPWDRLSPRVLLVWPLIVMVALFVATLTESDAATLFLAFITLSFLYVGVTQPPRTAFVLLPFGAATWWAALAQDQTVGGSLLRLTFAMVVWTLVAEVPARLLERVQRMQVQLAVRAGTDALTGLSNRHDLPRALAALLPGDSLVLLDLDHFKDFNDEHGHQAGDLVLADFGAFLGRTVRSSDLAFRYGGEEFLLMLSQTSTAEAQHLVDRAAATWTRRTQLTFSAGIATANGVGDDSALSKADAALYAAKAAGRATSRVHEHEPD